jgi:hypothetical protein
MRQTLSSCTNAMVRPSGETEVSPTAEPGLPSPSGADTRGHRRRCDGQREKVVSMRHDQAVVTQPDRIAVIRCLYNGIQRSIENKYVKLSAESETFK